MKIHCEITIDDDIMKWDIYSIKDEETSSICTGSTHQRRAFQCVITRMLTELMRVLGEPKERQWVAEKEMSERVSPIPVSLGQPIGQAMAPVNPVPEQPVDPLLQ